MKTPPYSLIRKAGNTYYLAGHTAMRIPERTISKGIESQTRDCLDALRDTLEGEGLSMRHIVKTTVFLQDMDDFAAMNEVYADYFDAPYPARSTVEAAQLPKVALDGPVLVEIEAVAYNG